MVSEEQFIKLSQFEINIRCGSTNWPLLKIIKLAILMAGAASSFYMAWSFEIHSTKDLLTPVVITMEGVTFVVYLFRSLTRNGNLQSLNNQMHETDSTYSADYTILTIIVVSLSVIFSRIYAIFVQFTITLKLVISCTALMNISLLKLVTFNYILSKRLRKIRTAESSSVDQLIADTRMIMDLNKKLNEQYSASLASFGIVVLLRLLGDIYVLWQISGLGNEDIPYVFRNRFQFITSSTTLYLTALFQMLISSFLTAEIEKIKINLDRMKTMGNCTKKQKMIISAFLMELHFSPVQITALDLFNLDRISLTAVSASVINYLMVMIQFSRNG